MPSLNSNVMCSEMFPNKSNFHNCNAYLSECMAFLSRNLSTFTFTVIHLDVLRSDKEVQCLEYFLKFCQWSTPKASENLDFWNTL